MPYEDNSVYNKFQSYSSEDGCCGGASSGGDCGCCPPGLVAVNDSEGTHIACLTPADAQEYNENNISCGAGFIKLFNNATDPPTFLGCVAAADFAELNASVNPVA